MEKLKQIYQYIKNNKLYITVMIIGSIMFIIHMNGVVLYADDFGLGVTSKGGISEIFKYFTNNYMNWGGGLTCLIASMFLMFDISIWKIFQCAIVILTVILATRMITYKDKKHKALVSTIIWTCLYILNIVISREVLYWLDGGLAYEFTAFQIFLYFYYLYTRMILKINKKYDKILLSIVAFFAGWSSAQTGPLVVIIPILLMIWQKFIQKEKISKFYYITTIIGIIGFAIFYFAPGNSARMLTFKEYASYNLIQRIFYRVECIYGQMFNFIKYKFISIPFYMLVLIGLNAVIGLKLFNKEENKTKKILAYTTSIIQIGYIVLCLVVSLNIPKLDWLADLVVNFKNILYAQRDGVLTLQMFIPYIITTIVMISTVIESYLICLKKKDPFLVITIISALIMQVIMVMAPYSPLRTTYYTIMFYWFAIAYLIKHAYIEKSGIVLIFILPIAIYNLVLACMILIAYILIKIFAPLDSSDVIKIEISIVICVMLIVALINYITILKNYYINKNIYYENIRIIEEYKKNNSNEKELYLNSPINEMYGFTPMVGTDWVEDAVKDYFELDKEVILKAKEVK